MEIHVLPCLIKGEGVVDVRGKFADKTFTADTSTSQEEYTLGNLNIHDVCGMAAEKVDFNIEGTEYFERRVYSSDKGTDPLLRSDHLCNFLRGRSLRGRQLNLDALGHRMSVVEVGKGSTTENPLLRNKNIPFKCLTEKEGVASITIWNKDEDMSPMDANLAAYKHLLIASAVSDYSGERQFIEGHNVQT